MLMGKFFTSAIDLARRLKHIAHVNLRMVIIRETTKIPGVAQGCHLGNQAEFVVGPHMSTNQQKNFIGMYISRFNN